MNFSRRISSIADWIAERVGSAFEPSDDSTIDSLDEQEVSEQLQHGRD